MVWMFLDEFDSIFDILKIWSSKKNLEICKNNAKVFLHWSKTLVVVFFHRFVTLRKPPFVIEAKVKCVVWFVLFFIVDLLYWATVDGEWGSFLWSYNLLDFTIRKRKCFRKGFQITESKNLILITFFFFVKFNLLDYTIQKSFF